MFANRKKIVFDIPRILYFVAMKIRGLISKIFGDPPIVVVIHGKRLYMPLSHNLPIYINRFKFYDTALTRISKFLRSKKQSLAYIDVGANIGDSIYAIDPLPTDKIIGIEPDQKFQKYLRKNLKGYANIIIEEVICSSSSKREKVRIIETNGTAKIVKDSKSKEMVKETLDGIVKRNKFGNVDLLKVDTDGHDFEVLKGARNTIKKHKPAIFFECDSFGNKNYVKDIFDLFEFLRLSGYNSAIMYDNFGYLFGKFDLEDKERFEDIFFYQLNSGFYYFDILIMEEKK